MMKFVTIKSIFVIAIFLHNTSFSQEDEVLMPYLKGDKYGYANSKGQIVIEPKYDYVLLFEKGYALVRLNNKWGLIKENGHVIIQPIASQLSNFDSNNLTEITVENKSGVINTKGEWVVPCNYARVDIKSNFIEVTNSDNQTALFDLKGKTIVDFKNIRYHFPESTLALSNFIITVLNQQFGLSVIEKTGKFKERIAPQYQSLRILNDKFFEVKQDDKWGLIDSENKLIVPFEYSNFKKEGLFIIAEQEIEYQIKIKLFEPEFYTLSRRMDDIEREFDNEKRIVYYLMTQEEQYQMKSMGMYFDELTEIRLLYSLINEQGQIVIPAQFGEISLNKPFIQVRTDKGVTLFDKQGKQVSSVLFDQVGEIKEGLVLVKIGSMENLPENYNDLSESDKLIATYNRFKYGYMDSIGEMVLPLQYNGAFEFNLNRAPVRLVDKWGLINKKGELITECKYDQLYFAGEQRYGFRIGQRWGLLDLNGHEIIPATYYEYIKASYNTDQFGGYSGLVFENGYAKSSKQLPGFLQTSTTLIDTNGAQLFPFKYKTIEQQNGGLFKVSLQNHDHDQDSYGLIDKGGNEIVAAYQDNIRWLETEKVFVVAKYSFKNDYTYCDQKGQEIASPFKKIEQEGLREYKQLSNGYYSAKYNHHTVYFTPDGIPLFEK